MADYLQYWKHSKNLALEVGSIPSFSASNQFIRRKIAVGDTIWLVTLLDSHLTLLGRLRVEALLNYSTARKRFGNSIYVARTYAVDAPEFATPLTQLDITRYGVNLRFEGGQDRLTPHPDGTIDGKQIQTIRKLSPESVRLLSELLGLSSPSIAIDTHEDLQTLGTAKPARRRGDVYRVLRDTKLGRKLKELYGHKCQLCGLILTMLDGSLYAEAHHIRPLGNEHRGSDRAENILILCPNHHVMFDYGAIALKAAELTIHPSHTISAASIKYHNRVRLQNAEARPRFDDHGTIGS